MEKSVKKISILDRWKERTKTSIPTAITKAPVGIDLPLSRGQERLFFLEQLYPDNPVYNSSEIFNFKGPLVIEKIEGSLRAIVFTHESLRTSIHLISGKPVQKVHENVEFQVSKFDVSNLQTTAKTRKLEEIMTADSLKTFDLRKPPLIRFSVIKCADAEYILFVTTHHIITDKWSMGIFQAQLARYYRENFSIDEFKACKANKIEFGDYAYWQQNADIDTDQLAYWKKKLAGETPLLDLPADFPQPVQPTFKGGSHVHNLTKELSSKVLALCKKIDTTPYVLLLTVYYALLHRYTGQKDILIGSPISFRNSRALEDIIGFFDETIVLRTTMTKEMSFSQLLRKVRSTVLDAFSNNDIPFDVLVKELQPERVMSGNPFFRTMFIYHKVPTKPFFASEIEMSHSFYNTGISKFDLTLYISNEADVLSTEFEYSKDLFDVTSIERFQEHLRLLLEGIVKDPDTNINKIPMLTQQEAELIEPKHFSTNDLLAKGLGIHEIIGAKAQENPDGVALIMGDEEMSYKKLDEESNRIAQRVLTLSKGENQIVGLCIERSLKMVVGLLGILKAGCAYLPIDLKYPSKRTAYTLQDSGITILLSQQRFFGDFDDFKGFLMDIDELDGSDLKTSFDFPSIKGDALAYVIYTSGSTGKPKGVPITHANIISSTEARLDFYPKNPTSFLLMSSISFDSSKAGLFWTLCTGGTLVISENQLEQDIEKLTQVIFDHSISHTLLLPSLYKMILEYSEVSKLRSLQAVIVAGEECTSALCVEHFEKLPEARLYNEYGPTEATVWCMAHQIVPEDVNDLIPIGKSTSNAQIYVLNSKQEPVPYGAIGELYVAGPSLSGKYLNKPALTDECYIKHPFDESTNELLYRTGDLGRYRNDGALIFLGRRDQQVKIRGFRIELNEIENAILHNPFVLETVVLAEKADNQDESKSTDLKKVVAYVTADSSLDTKVLYQQLIKEIPSYMLPSHIYQIEKFPELPNGKVDKNGLQALGLHVRSQKEANITEPRNEVESDLVQIWEKILGTSPIGITDNYFEVGGDSMTSIRMFWHIEKQMKIKLSPSILFVHPTIEAIARKISEVNKNKIKEFKYVIPFKTSGTKQPLFCIHGGEGHVLFYKKFAKYLSCERPVYLVQPKGADGDDDLHVNIEQMATDYLKEISQVQSNGPINFVFYCCGALVVEISNQLNEIGRTANMIIVDSSPNYVQNNDVEKDSNRYTFYLKRVFNSPFTTVRKSLLYRFRRYVLPLYVSNLNDTSAKRHIKIRNRLEEMQNDYEWNKFDARCTLIIGSDGIAHFDKKDIESWNHWCRSQISVCYSTGNHYNIFDEPHVKSLAETTENACL